MDLKPFANQNFNAKEWLNNAFKSPDALANKDAFAASLVMKLQLLIQEVNHSLEDTSQQILQTLPRVVKDADAISQEALQLQEQMKFVKEDIVKVERNTAESMQMLMKIDTVKTRMLAASKALQEADNWTTLAANVDDVFQKGDISAIADKLVAMQQSLEILVDVPDYSERVKHLENLKNRLEAMLSPQLIVAFNTQPIDATLVYVRIFRDIRRLEELEKYYHKCHKEKLLNQWKAIVESDPDETLLEWLNNFYDLLLSTWHIQAKWSSQVFVEMSTVSILCNLLADTLKSMDPSLSFCINAALKHQMNPLEYLMDLKQISERFCKSIEAAIHSYGAGTENKDSEAVSLLIESIFLPYKFHIQKYPQYEESLLLHQLTSVTTEAEDLLDSVSLLGESVSKVSIMLRQAIDRCNTFTNGCMFFGLSETFKVVLAAYIRRFNAVFDQFKHSYTVSGQQSSLCDDWSLFQHSLNTIQITGELFLQMDLMEQTFISSQIAAAKKGNYFSNSSEKQEMGPIFRSDKVLLNMSERSTLRQFLVRVVEGNDPSALSAVKEMVRRLSDNAVNTTFELIFAQIQNYLNAIPRMKIWISDTSSGVLTADLPDFSISPLEYITQIGQYLMTIPQHIEPFTLEDNPALKIAFQHANVPNSTGKVLENSEELADYILNCIAQGMMDIYTKAILKIDKLETHASKQLATDIDYLLNILDDLGLKATTNMQNILALLKATRQEFRAVSEGKPPYLVKAVLSMRNLQVV